MSGLKSGVLCHSSLVLLCRRGALESKSHQQLIDKWQQLFEQQDDTIIVLCTIHFHPWLHENHTSAYISAPEDTDTQEHVYQKPARYVHELKWHPIEIWSATSRTSLINR